MPDMTSETSLRSPGWVARMYSRETTTALRAHQRQVRLRRWLGTLAPLLSDRERQVLDALTEGPSRPRPLRRACGLAKRPLDETLARLRRDGLVVRFGNVYWLREDPLLREARR